MRRRRPGLAAGTLLLVLLSAPPARAEISQLTVAVDGLGCPFCVYGIEKKLKAVEGAREVNVDLKTGVAAIKIAYGAYPRATELREAVKQAGFTAGEIRLTAIGTVDIKGKTARLHLRGSDGVYSLLPEERHGLLDPTTWNQLHKWQKQAATVAVTGTMHQEAGAETTISIEKVDRLHSVTFAIEGMSCEKCAERLARLLEQEEGVYRAWVSFSDKAARVESIGRPLDASKLISVVEDAGFKATVHPEAAPP